MRQFDVRQKGFAPILILLLVVVLGGLGYFAYKNYIAPKGSLLGPLLPSPTATATINSTANWVTYTNEKNGFSFEYPSSFEELNPESYDDYYYALESKVQTKNAPKAIFLVNIMPTSSQEDFSKCGSSDDMCFLNTLANLKGLKTSEIEYTQVTIFNTIRKGFFYTTNQTTNGMEQYNSFIVFKVNGNIWSVESAINEYSENLDKNYLSTFNQILSTFKFTQ